MSAAGGSDVIITIAGDSAPLVAALTDAGAAFDDMAVSAGASSDDIASSMTALASVIDQLAAEIDVLAASMDNMTASATNASAATDEAGAAAGTAAVDVMSLGDAIDMLSAAFDDLLGPLGPLIATFGTLIAVMGAMTIINDVSNWIQNLISQMFQLDEQTQKTVNSWQYLFANAPGGGKNASQGLAQWAYNESPNLPFTAMDLRGAISTLGTAGYTPQQIEQFIPFLADIAATLGTAAYGGQGITLSQGANAIRSAGFGLTRMLRTDLGISPSQLVPYGLDATVSSSGAVKILNMATLMPAIENFVRGRGLMGAAQEQEVNTFWGAWSSFQDYLQNWMQTAGGINPQTGQVEKGSMFGDLQQILVGVNQVLGQAQETGVKGKGPSLGGLTGVVGNILGGGVGSIMSLFEGITGGAGAAGAGKVIDNLYHSLKNFGEWLQSATVQKDIKEIGAAIGQFLGDNLKSAQAAMPDLEHAFTILGQTIGQLWHSISPQQMQMLKTFGGDIVELTAGFVALIAAMVNGIALVNTVLNGIAGAATNWAKNLANQFRTWGVDFIQMLMDGIRSMLPNFGGLINNIANGIAAKLHFSKPDEGPLADADMWMPDMMALFARGIQQGLPAVAAASRQAAAAIGAPIHGVAVGIGGGGVSNSYGPSTNYGGGNTSNLSFYGSTQTQIEMAIANALRNMDRIGALTQQQPGGMFLFGMH